MDKKTLTPEELAKETRRKQLATLKASNELLEYAKQTVMQTDRLDDASRTERIMDIDKAIDLNNQKAKFSLHATQEEMENIQYNEASEEAKRKYKERLEKQQKTAEDIERKEMATIAYSEDKAKTKRKHMTAKQKAKAIANLPDEVIERLPNEDELMKKSMATAEKIEERMRRSEKPESEIEKEIKEQIVSKKVPKKENVGKVNDEISTVDETKTVVSSKKTSSGRKTSVKYDFDFSNIPDYVQYDIIPLPSEGKCYPIDSPLRGGRIPVAYLTASDENIIASPNMYRDGKIIDTILKRKVLDKRIDVEDLCKGDRDAVVLWLRATGYGPNFPIVATHPTTGKKYDVGVDLSKLKYKDFDLEGDNDGNFDYVLSNGDIIKFNFNTQSMEDEYRKKIIENNIDIEKINMNKYLKNIEDCIEHIEDFSEQDVIDINGCISDIRDILNETLDNDEIDETQFSNAITEQMIMHTRSINGKNDAEYIRGYIENMRSNDARNYRTTILENKPGVNFDIKIDVPESDGGGSFNTFLALRDDVFLNI